MILINPVTVAVGTTTKIDLNANQAVTPTKMIAPDQVRSLLFANESPYALLVQYPKVARWVLPWTEDMLPGNVELLTITPSVVTGGTALPAAAQSKAVLITAFLDTDDPPSGTWPIALVRQVGLGNQLNVASQTFSYYATSFSGTTNTNSATIPAQAGYNFYLCYLMFSCSPLSAGISDYQLDVTQTGGGTWSQLIFADNSGPVNLAISFNPAFPNTFTNATTVIAVSQVAINSQAYSVAFWGYYA